MRMRSEVTMLFGCLQKKRAGRVLPVQLLMRPGMDDLFTSEFYRTNP